MTEGRTALTRMPWGRSSSASSCGHADDGGLAGRVGDGGGTADGGLRPDGHDRAAARGGQAGSRLLAAPEQRRDVRLPHLVPHLRGEVREGAGAERPGEGHEGGGDGDRVDLLPRGHDRVPVGQLPGTTDTPGWAASSSKGCPRAVHADDQPAVPPELLHHCAPQGTGRARDHDRLLRTHPAHSPRHTGGRFSANARAPSCASSDANTGFSSSCCRLHHSSAGHARPWVMISFVARTASGPLAAIGRRGRGPLRARHRVRSGG